MAPCQATRVGSLLDGASGHSDTWEDSQDPRAREHRVLATTGGIWKGYKRPGNSLGSSLSIYLEGYHVKWDHMNFCTFQRAQLRSKEGNERE